jgi:hypothetical protein
MARLPLYMGNSPTASEACLKGVTVLFRQETFSCRAIGPTEVFREQLRNLDVYADIPSGYCPSSTRTMALIVGR